MKFFLGCSGWFYNHWIERFYPRDLRKYEWLRFYSSQFNTVEVNSTFYNFPKKKMLKSWYGRTPEDFVFTLKANRLITHERRFEGTKGLIDRFYEISDNLKEKLGCILFQIPPLDKDLEFLKKVLNQLEKDYKNVIEFRHKSWYCEEVYDLLREKGVGFCIVSAPNLPEDLKVTSKIAYLRFHGKEQWYRYHYSKEELKAWARKIKRLDAKEVFCYFNNDYEANAPKNCQELKEHLKKSRTPVTVLETINLKNLCQST